MILIKLYNDFRLIKSLIRSVSFDVKHLMKLLSQFLFKKYYYFFDIFSL